MNVIINGRFLAEKMQGITRYAFNVLLNLDEEVGEKDTFLLVCPPGAQIPKTLKRIKPVFFGKRRGIAWELRDLKKFLKKTPGIYLGFCNTMPFIKTKAIVTVHDVMYKTDYKTFTTFRNKVSALWHRLQYRYIAKHAFFAATDSYHAQKELIQNYSNFHDKTRVISPAWQHVLEWGEDESWREKYPFLQKNQFYFSLASLAKNKNGKWIVEVAKKNPDQSFAIAGRFYNDDSLITELPKNVHLLGSISDATASSLIKNCKAFLFPSLNEGFGIPPLEALGLGARVVASNRDPMVEVLADAAAFIDPLDYNVDLETVLAAAVGDPGPVLRKYSWKKAAEDYYRLLRECDEG